MWLKDLWPFKQKEKPPMPTRSEDITAMRGADDAKMLEIETRHLKRLKKEGASKFLIACQTETVNRWKNSEKRKKEAGKARAKYEKSQAQGRRRGAKTRKFVNNVSLFFVGDYVTPPEDDSYVPAPGGRVLFQHNGAICRPERPDSSFPAQKPTENANVWGSWDEQLSRQFTLPMEEAARIRADIEHGKITPIHGDDLVERLRQRCLGSTKGSTVEESTDFPGARGSSQGVRDGFRLYKAERALGEKIDMSTYKLATNSTPWPPPRVAWADTRPPTPPHMRPGDLPLLNAAILNGPPKPPRASPYEKPTTKWSLPPLEAPQPAPAPLSLAPGAGEVEESRSPVVVSLIDAIDKHRSEQREWFARNSIRGIGGPSHRMATSGPYPRLASPSRSHPHGEPLHEEEFFRGRAAGSAKRVSVDFDALGAIETDFLYQNRAPLPAAIRPTSEVPTEEDFEGQVEFIPLNLTCSNPEEGMTLAEMLASEGLEDSGLPPAAKLIEVAKKPSLRIKGFGVSPSVDKKSARQSRAGKGERTFNEGGIDMDVYRTRRLGDPYRDSGITRGRYEKTIDHERAAEIIKTARELEQHPEETFKSIKGIRHRPGNGRPKVGFVDYLQRFVAASEGKDLDFFAMHARQRGAIKQSERYEEQQLKKRLEQRAREAEGLLPLVEEAPPVRITYGKPPTPKGHLAMMVEEKRPFDPVNNFGGGIQLPTLSSYGRNNTGRIQLPALSSYETGNTEIAQFPAPLPYMTTNVEAIQIPTLSSYGTDNAGGTQLPAPSSYGTYNTEGVQFPAPSPYGADNAGRIQSPTLSSYRIDNIEGPQFHAPSSYRTSNSQGNWPNQSMRDDNYNVRRIQLQYPDDDGYPHARGLNVPEGNDFSYNPPPHPEDLGPYKFKYTGLQIDDSDDEDQPSCPPDISPPMQPAPVPLVGSMDSMLFPRTCDVKRMVKPRGLETGIPMERKKEEVKKRIPTLTVEGSASALLINALVKVKNERASRGDTCGPLKLLEPTPEDEVWIMKFNFDVILETERLAKESGNDVCVKSAVMRAAKELGVDLPETAGSYLLDLRTWLMREYYERRASVKAQRRLEAELLLEREQREREMLKPEADPSENRNITDSITMSHRSLISQEVGERDQSRLGSQPTTPRPESQPTTLRPESKFVASRSERQPTTSRPGTLSTDSRPGSQSASPQRRIGFGASRPANRREQINPPSPLQAAPARDSSQSESSTRTHYRRSSLGSSPSSPTVDAYLHSIPEGFPVNMLKWRMQEFWNQKCKHLLPVPYGKPESGRVPAQRTLT
ncbi:uncharacterized protein DFL_003778 [Arthrobotrys flagrans]|uniref:Uncharacterized protein n=1 Tax=Arthrobotrys flagrans TaxID=97331 RepID=A0A437A2Y7_ARTFL|nr:hypothetical protein DFL_003778 [Arthrobotrys flagrans]